MQRNLTNGIIKKAKKEMEKNIAVKSKENPKLFWNYIRSKTKCKSKISDLEDEKGSLESDNEKKAEILNQYFAKVFTIENTEIIPELICEKVNTNLSEIKFEIHKVEEKLKALKPNKSPGPDLISNDILRSTSKNVSKPLSLLFTQSINTGELPQDWKTANVSPIYKNGNKQHAENYRPISLTSVPCKIMESIIKENLVNYLEMNNLLSDTQYGFRSKRSCTLQLLEVYDIWTESLDHGIPIDMLYLDFQKAFDSVPHLRLIEKLHNLGIDGKLLNWIHSFITNRTQRVMIGDSSSNWVQVKSGVPQGSVLGPTLFLAFINDFPENINSTIRLFADDAKLYRPIKTENDKEILQNDINKLCEWSDKWQLNFNVNKCRVLHVGNRNLKYDYQMSIGPELPNITQTQIQKDLGVYFQQDASFKEYISKAVKKANRILGLIKRNFTQIDNNMLITLYKSLVRPILEYGCQVWSPMTKNLNNQIESVQRRITKIMRNLKKQSYPERLKTLGIPTLKFRRLRADMIQIYKILHDIDAKPPELLLNLSEEPRTRGNSLKLKKVSVNTSLRQSSWTIRSISWWNQLPDNVVQAPSVNSFKSRLNTHWKDLEIKFGDNES